MKNFFWLKNKITSLTGEAFQNGQWVESFFEKFCISMFYDLDSRAIKLKISYEWDADDAEGVDLPEQLIARNKTYLLRKRKSIASPHWQRHLNFWKLTGQLCKLKTEGESFSTKAAQNKLGALKRQLSALTRKGQIAYKAWVSKKVGEVAF